jgi:hypothetical protein
MRRLLNLDGFAGTFREVKPPSRLVHTEIYDPGTVGDAHPRAKRSCR